ncbi:hypothetical protein [Sagittula stellata]|uniref:Uncharacterized protein n=1 Tax=Sagittula stellata (strain ATCC 700073 / DSM 11524 / E-37) TaxID=388399 RepID=A3K044_SAGS3|nr:hypothetical protein [Sagittula stellata]EBA09159.1 hypothetical protein SSE37_22994 [Sagittula stellata E-37]
MRFLALCLTLLPLPLGAWETPRIGTALRADLMDAMRPHAEWIFGAPLVFRVDELRVDGDVAFAMLEPLRKDGRAMTPADLIPGHSRDIFEFDGPAMQALFRRSGNTWVAVHWAIGATDAWWFGDPYCSDWKSVIPEAC